MKNKKGNETNMKKVLALCLSLVLLCAVLTACSAKTSTTTSSSATAATAAAEKKLDFPTKPIELVVPFSAGGGTHLAAELLAPEAEKYLGVPLNITCKGGGGGAIGSTYVANAKPDGYTLLYNTISLPTALALGDCEFDKTALVAVARCSAIAPVIAVRADAPFNTAQEMVAWINEHPQEFSWAFPGVGSGLHLCGANALNVMGVTDKIVDMPFDGTSEGLAAVLGGHVTAISCFMSSLSEQVKAGEIKVIGIQNTERSADWPDIPTFLEQGYDATVTNWRGIFAPAGTPQEVLDYLNDAFAQIIGTDDYLQRANDLGEGRAYLDAKDFNEAYLNDCDTVAAIVKQIGLGD